MKVSVILPTLNEEKNVPRIYESLSSELQSFNYEIIFIDDNSNDNTRGEIEYLKKKDNNIRSIYRIEKNLSTAFIDGLNIARGELIVLMDSDLQHDAVNIRKSIDKIEREGFDMVIGSRFLKGSQNYKSSLKSYLRLILSKTFIKIFNFIFKTDLSDPLSGFFVVKKNTIKGKDDFLFKNGFKIVMDYYLLLKGNIVIGEIPISLNKRHFGHSKLNFKILSLIFKQVLYYLNKND